MTTFYGATDTGLVRETNQDRFEYGVLGDGVAFAVLCDGMGGHSGGNVASETATRFIADRLRRDLRADMTEMSLRGVVESAASGANALVHEASKQNPELASMGTTMVIAVIHQNQLYVSYVGDSRVYLVSGGREQQLTKDHTVVQMLVDIGEISQEDAQCHPKRHYITRAVGVSPTVEADFLAQELREGDMVLLCSDGLYSYLTPGVLPELLRRCAQQGGVAPLIDLAKAGGGTDNITAVVGIVGAHGGNASNG